MKEKKRRQWIRTISLLRGPSLFEGIPLPKHRGPSETERERETKRRKIALHYHSRAADSSSPAVPGWGSPEGEEWHPLKLHHLAEHAHMLCHISQVSAYNKGPALSERPTWCLWPFSNWTWYFPQNLCQPELATSFQKHFCESTLGRIRLIQLLSALLKWERMCTG